jgi:uncharacterized protein YbjT (DUF2867 family)
MYVITGATGNTGRVIAEKLLAKGEKVRAVARHVEHLQPLTAKGAEAFPGDLTETARLTEAFRGAKAAYVLIPPSLSSNDYRAYQEQVGDAIATAVRNAGVRHVVSLSSIGADKPDKTGPVQGLHRLEQKLNQIEGLNVLHLRAGYFMENTLAQVNPIRAMGSAAGPLRPDLKVPMIAARDIGDAAADALARLDFSDKQIRELHGQRDLSYTDVASVVGKAIGKPQLAYVQVSGDQFRAALTQMGMSADVADLLLEMSESLNSGYMRALEPRSARNTTPTSYETFVAEEFVPLFQRQAVA